MYYKWRNVYKKINIALKERLQKLECTRAEDAKSRTPTVNAHEPSKNNYAHFSKDSAPLNENEAYDFKELLIKSLDIPFIKELKDFTPKTFYADLLINASSETYLIVISLLKDKIYQLYLDQTQQYDWQVRRAHSLIEKGAATDLYEGHDASNERVIWAAKRLYEKHMTDYIHLVQQIPGLTDLNAHDFAALVSDNMATVLGIKVIKLFINGESYLFNEGIQLSKKWIRLLYGPTFAEKLFYIQAKLNKLEMSIHEIALLIPMLLTTPNKGKYSYHDIVTLKKVS